MATIEKKLTFAETRKMLHFKVTVSRDGFDF
jgi:hypothetical protein